MDLGQRNRSAVAFNDERAQHDYYITRSRAVVYDYFSKLPVAVANLLPPPATVMLAADRPPHLLVPTLNAPSSISSARSPGWEAVSGSTRSRLA